jgi:hypothetical protein
VPRPWISELQTSLASGKVLDVCRTPSCFYCGPFRLVPLLFFDRLRTLCNRSGVERRTGIVRVVLQAADRSAEVVYVILRIGCVADAFDEVTQAPYARLLLFDCLLNRLGQRDLFNSFRFCLAHGRTCAAGSHFPSRRISGPSSRKHMPIMSRKLVLTLPRCEALTDNGSDLDEAINYAVVHHLGNTISNSWSGIEGFGPGGHLKLPHPWPGQTPPLDSSGTSG